MSPTACSFTLPVDAFPTCVWEGHSSPCLEIKALAAQGTAIPAAVPAALAAVMQRDAVPCKGLGNRVANSVQAMERVVALPAARRPRRRLGGAEQRQSCHTRADRSW